MWITNEEWVEYMPTDKEVKYNELCIQLDLCIEKGWKQQEKQIRKQLLNYVF